MGTICDFPQSPRRAPALAFAALLALLAPCAHQAPTPLPSVAAATPLDTAAAHSGKDSARPDGANENHRSLVTERMERRGRRMTPLERQRVVSTIMTASAHYQVSPHLVLAVIEIESGYNPHAVSPVGAMGLMQLMPGTGAEVAERTGEVWRGTSTLFDPEANIRLGVAYLRELIDRYESIRIALAAYNWGPGRIDRRLRSGSGLPAKYPNMVLGAYSRVGGSPIGS